MPGTEEYGRSETDTVPQLQGDYSLVGNRMLITQGVDCNEESSWDNVSLCDLNQAEGIQKAPLRRDRLS